MLASCWNKRSFFISCFLVGLLYLDWRYGSCYGMESGAAAKDIVKWQELHVLVYRIGWLTYYMCWMAFRVGTVR